MLDFWIWLVKPLRSVKRQVMRELLGKIPTKDPKPSVTGTLRKIHFYIECEKAI
jgi:hypothetical protein